MFNKWDMSGSCHYCINSFLFMLCYLGNFRDIKRFVNKSTTSSNYKCSGLYSSAFSPVLKHINKRQDIHTQTHRCYYIPFQSQKKGCFLYVRICYAQPSLSSHFFTMVNATITWLRTLRMIIILRCLKVTPTKVSRIFIFLWCWSKDAFISASVQ